MKPRHEDESPFNTPQEMLVRAGYLLCVAGFGAAIVLTVLGTMLQDLRLLGAGLVSLAAAAMLREGLHRGGHFERADLGFREFIGRGRPRADEREPDEVEALMNLLRECEILERQRGSPGFDPWQLLAVRHDIREIVEKHPTLQRLVRL